MTIDQATEHAFKHYQKIIKAKGLKATNHCEGEDEGDNFKNLHLNQQLEHCLWMCEKMLHHSTKHFSIDKKSRWMGFVQGVLILNGITTIKRERNITRPWFTGKGTQ